MICSLTYAFNPLLHRFTPLILTHRQQTAFENIVGKEEIARYEQFLLFPQCFLLNQKIASPFVNIYDIISLFGRAKNWHVRLKFSEQV